MRRPALQDLCAGYRLGKTGTVVKLTENLQEFSKYRQEWDV